MTRLLKIILVITCKNVNCYDCKNFSIKKIDKWKNKYELLKEETKSTGGKSHDLWTGALFVMNNRNILTNEKISRIKLSYKLIII